MCDHDSATYPRLALEPCAHSCRWVTAPAPTEGTGPLMPNRIIKDSIRTSESINQLTAEEEVFWYRLITLLDDFGRYDGRPSVLRSAAFPLRVDSVTVEMVEGYLVKLAEVGSISRYEVGGKPYLVAGAWATHNPPRAKASRWPDPPGSEQTQASASRREQMSPYSDSDSLTGYSIMSEKPRRGDVEALCNLLVEQIEANGAKKPTVTKKWQDAARLMLDRDERPFDEAAALIRWSQADEFWRSNILSMPKFRTKYDTLKLQSKRKGKPKGYKPGERALELAGIDVAEETKRWEERRNGEQRSHADRGLPGGDVRP